MMILLYRYRHCPKLPENFYSLKVWLIPHSTYQWTNSADSCAVTFGWWTCRNWHSRCFSELKSSCQASARPFVHVDDLRFFVSKSYWWICLGRSFQVFLLNAFTHVLGFFSWKMNFIKLFKLLSGMSYVKVQTHLFGTNAFLHWVYPCFFTLLLME